MPNGSTLFYLRATTSSYTAIVSFAVLRQVHKDARCRERADLSARNVLYVRTPYMASTRAWVSSGSRLSAASPTTSGSDVRFEQITGAPQLIASSGVSPKPS